MNPRIRRIGSAPILVAMFAALWLAGCATQETAPESDAADATDAASEAAAEEALPRAFFTNLEDGQAIPTSYEIIFGVENFNIVPIEDPLVVRPGEGHYHLAFDVDCAPAGEVIVAGSASYVHFGNGSDRITAQFEPGEHRLCLQVADGEHRVLAGPENTGLTQEVRISAEEQ